MPLTLLGWLLIVSSLAISALFIFPRLRSLGPGFGPGLRSTPGTLIVVAAIFLLFAGIGAVTSPVGAPPRATGSGDTVSSVLSHSGPDGELLAHLKDYTRSIGTKDTASVPAAGKLQPDVNTMIERLAARLETAPNDVKGWRMLGWSYYHTGRYQEAASAYARAVALDPNSAELKLTLAEAKAKAAEGGNSKAASASKADAIEKRSDASGGQTNAGADAPPPRAHDALIRSMVDGLASRLESSPRDVDGWTRLIRSRVVLGETEVAATTFRKALEIFKDDPAASGKIAAAAIELGLKAE